MPSLYQQGNLGAGLSSAIGIPGVGTQIQVIAAGWTRKSTANLKERFGRETLGDVKYRFRNKVHGFVAEGKIPGTAPPEPSNWEGQITTIVVQFGAGRTITYTVTIQKFEAEGQSKNDLWGFTATLLVIGDPLYSDGWGEQPSAGSVIKSDLTDYEDASITYDPASVPLAHAQTQTIDWWGLSADTDAAFKARLIAAVSASVAAISGLKNRPAIGIQDAPDGGTFTIPFALTDTNDDVTMPRSVLNVDPNKLQTNGTVAALNATPTLPTVSGQTIVLRKTAIQKLNDGATVNTAEVGQRDTKDDVEMDESSAIIDKSGIASTGQTVVVFAAGGSVPADASSPDASLKVVSTEIKELNLDQNKKITYFDPNSEIEKLIFAKTSAKTDSSALASAVLKGAIFTTGSAPSPPGVSGLVLRDFTDFTVVSPDTTNLSMRIWLYAETTTADDKIFELQKIETDPSGVNTVNIQAEIFVNSSPPSTPSNPSGLVLALETDIPLTDASASNKSIRVWRFETQTAAEKIEHDASHTYSDPNLVESESELATVFTNGSPPSAPAVPLGELQHVGVDTKPINDNLSNQIDKYDVLNSLQKISFPKSQLDIDAFDLETQEPIPVFYNIGSSPTEPSVPTGLKLIKTMDFPVTPATGSKPGIRCAVFVFAKRSSADEVELGSPRFPHYFVDVDPSGVESEGELTKIGGTPSTPSGQQVRKTRTLTITQGTGVDYTATQIHTGVNLVGEDIVFENSHNVVDPSSIDDLQAIAVLATSPSTPSTPSGLVLYQTVKRTKTSSATSNLQLWVFIYRRLTVAQEMAIRESSASIDPLIGEEIEVTTVEAWSSTAAALEESIHGANKSDVLYDGVRAELINNAVAKYRKKSVSSTIWLLGGTGRFQEVRLSCIPDPSTGGFGLPDVQVMTNLPDAYSVANSITTFYGGIIQSIGRLRGNARFVLRRRFITDSPVASYLFQSQWGTVNNAAFLDFPQYSLMLETARIRYDLHDTDPHLAVIDYQLFWDSMLHFSDGNVPVGRVTNRVAGVSSTAGRLLNPATYFDTTMQAQWPATSSFTALAA